MGSEYGSPLALVVVPTRELCTQVNSVMKSAIRAAMLPEKSVAGTPPSFLLKENLKSVAIFGGADRAAQIDELGAGTEHDRLFCNTSSPYHYILNSHPPITPPQPLTQAPSAWM